MNAPHTASPARKALVIGGSLGGLFAANLLLRAGWDVHVHERVADELESRGAGVVTHPELMEVLSAAGVDVTDGIGVEVRERITLTRDGQVEDSRPLPQKRWRTRLPFAPCSRSRIRSGIPGVASTFSAVRWASSNARRLWSVGSILFPGAPGASLGVRRPVEQYGNTGRRLERGARREAAPEADSF